MDCTSGGGVPTWKPLQRTSTEPTLQDGGVGDRDESGMDEVNLDAPVGTGSDGSDAHYTSFLSMIDPAAKQFAELGAEKPELKTQLQQLAVLFGEKVSELARQHRSQSGSGVDALNGQAYAGIQRTQGGQERRHTHRNERAERQSAGKVGVT